jgi:hypothetical protein
MLEVKTVVNSEDVTTNFYLIFAMRNTSSLSISFKAPYSQYICGPRAVGNCLLLVHKVTY